MSTHICARGGGGTSNRPHMCMWGYHGSWDIQGGLPWFLGPCKGVPGTMQGGLPGFLGPCKGGYQTMRGGLTGSLGPCKGERVACRTLDQAPSLATVARPAASAAFCL